MQVANLEQRDLLVIGGGSAGIAAAIKGAELGRRVALVAPDALLSCCAG